MNRPGQETKAIPLNPAQEVTKAIPSFLRTKTKAILLIPA